MASTLRDNDEWGDNDEREDPGDSYSLDEEYMASDGVFSQRFASKRLRQIAKSKLNPTKRKFIDETGFGDLKNISPFIVLHDLMEWLEMNIDTGKRELRPNQNKVIVFTRDMVKKVFDIPPGNRTVVLYKRHEQCELRNIYHKNGRAPIAHTVHALQKARNDNGGTTKRSWVLLALAIVLTPGTGNMVPLEYLKSHKDIEKVTEYSWDAHVLSVAINEVKKCQEKIKSHDITKFWFGGCFPMLAFRPLSETSYASLSPEVGVTGDLGAKDNYIEDIDPMENWKSVEEDVCGSLDDSLQNPVPFGVELERDFGAPKPQEEPVVLLSSREPGPYRDEEKARLKEEKKLKSKKITQFNLFDSLDNGNLDIAARNLFTNFKRIVAEDPDFSVDLNSFKPTGP
ncbi:hypothetical protein D1007_42115 [Hordeum vulgare]|nr:hypothetical protein D1007_42115 [Hordeum vulgare]